MKQLLICVLVFFSSLVAANEEDCPAAVDAAEAQNPNAYKNCDYSNSGLNGALHRAFSKTKMGEQLDEGASQDVEAKDISDKYFSSVEKTKLITAAEFSSPQQLSIVKFALLEKVALECSKGFVVEGERYLPTSSKVTKLELIYHCL